MVDLYAQPKKFHNIRVKYDYEYDCFNKKEMNKALEELKCIGLNYFDELRNKRPNLKLHYLCLCQGAALYYAHLKHPKTNPEYSGVKDFDVWLFVSGYNKDNKNYSSRNPRNEKIIVRCKTKKVDLLIYNSEEFNRDGTKNNDNLIIESHIAGWLFKQLVDLTVYLNAPLEIRAKRISLRDGISEDDALVQIMKRERSHKERFLRYYGIDIFDLTNFDLVINTQYLKPNDVADLIITFIKKIQQTPPS